MSGEKKPGGVTGKGFRPGQSGNEGGRPRGLERLFRDKLGEGGVDEAIDILLTVMRDPKAAAKDRLRAVEIIFDRGWGKPTQTVNGEIGIGMSAEQQAFLDALQLSPEERRKRIAEIDDGSDG